MCHSNCSLLNTNNESESDHDLMRKYNEESLHLGMNLTMKKCSLAKYTTAVLPIELGYVDMWLPMPEWI